MGHDYDRRFNVCTAGYTSVYTDDPAEVARLARERGIRFVDAGWADYRDVPGRGDVTEVVRRTDRRVPFDEILPVHELPERGGWMILTEEEIDAVRKLREEVPA